MRLRGVVSVWVPALLVTLAAATPARSEDPVDALVRGGRYAAADSLLRERLTSAQAAHGASSIEVARVLDARVDVALRSGNAELPEVLTDAQRAVAIKDALPGLDPAESSLSLYQLARVLHTQGHFSAGYRHYGYMVDLRKKSLGAASPDVLGPLLAKALDELAVDLEAARNSYAEAVDIAAASSDREAAQAARARCGLALAGSDPADPDPVIEAAVALRDAFAADPPRLAMALAGFADRVADRGLSATAAELLDETLRLWAANMDTTDTFTARCRGRLGGLRLASGDAAGARDLLGPALAVLGADPEADPAETAMLMSELAAAHEALGEADVARRWYAASRDAYAKSPESMSPEAAEAACGEARALAVAGHTSEALDVALRAADMGRLAARRTALALPEDLALRVSEPADEGLRLALALAARDVSDEDARRVCDALIRSRAVVLDEMAIRNRLRGEAESPGLAKLYEEFAAANAAYSGILVRGRVGGDPAAHDQEVNRLHEARDRAEAALAAHSLLFRHDRAQSRAGFDEVRAALPPGGALVAFARAGALRAGDPETYFAFVMRADTPLPTVAPLGAVSVVDALVRAWGREILRGGTGGEDERSCREAGEALRKAVWDPIAPGLAGCTRVFLVPDGTLNRVSFAALPSGAGAYLVETAPPVHYLATERDLTAGAGAIRGHGLLALGGPAFDEKPATVAGSPAMLASAAYRGPGADCPRWDSVRFDPLPAAEAEIDEVASLWAAHVGSEKPVRLAGRAAAESAFKREAPGKRVLHLATHAFVLDEPCGEVRESTRGVGRLGSSARPPETSEENGGAMPLSGFALAGANRRADAGPGEEDGILTSDEIADMDLRGVEWAVLSGCDTGLGAVHGAEGVFGLRRAFQTAGVETLIASLWPVDDEPTRSWMRRLYAARFEEGKDTMEAVREACLGSLQERRARGESTHPFFWGGFVAAGGWR